MERQEARKIYTSIWDNDEGGWLPPDTMHINDLWPKKQTRECAEFLREMADALEGKG